MIYFIKIINNYNLNNINNFKLIIINNAFNFYTLELVNVIDLTAVVIKHVLF